MPDNDHLVFDFHEHHDHIHRTTGYFHIHDRRPYHKHDLNGSIHYIDPAAALVVELHDVNGGTDAAAPIGSGGYDVSYRNR